MTTSAARTLDRVHGSASAETTAPDPVRGDRLPSIDALRGVIMVLMALDHVRDYFGAPVNPTDLATTTVALFVTRWITHACAPVFFLLAGVGVRFAARRRTPGELSRFLLTRGLWFLFLELVVLRCLGWQFNADYRLTVLTVLWAFGWGMIALAALVRLQVLAVGVVSVAMIALHNLLDGVPASAFGALAPLWTALHAPGVLFTDGTHTVFAAYMLVPWIGVMGAGYALGGIYAWDAVRRRALLLRVALGCIAAFVLLRAANVYGDAAPWSAQRTAAFTALSFINTTKYPPSLLYLLMTLGPALLALRALDAGMPRALRPAVEIGQVPLFYYLLHVPLIHLLAVLACAVRYGEVHWMFESPSLDRYPITQPPGWPLPLPAIYPIWLGVVAMLYPLCRWYAAVKRRRRDPWLSYL